MISLIEFAIIWNMAFNTVLAIVGICWLISTPKKNKLMLRTCVIGEGNTTRGME